MTNTQSKLQDLIKVAQRASVPLVAVSTPDSAATIAELVQALAPGMAKSDEDLGCEALAVEWDLLRGYQALGSEEQRKAFKKWLGETEVPEDGCQFNPPLAVALGVKLPPASVLFIHLAHRFLGESVFLQAVWNLRDAFKANHRMLVLLGPTITLPPEIAGDVVAIDEPLPDRAQLARIVTAQHAAAEIDTIKEGAIEKAVDAVQGLPAFAAEQVIAMSLRKSGLDLNALWERKRQQIEQTPGLKVYRGSGQFGSESFEDIGGVAVVKEFVRRIMTGSQARPNAVVFVDEIEKMLAGAGGDTSGVTQDQLGSLLSYMQDQAAAGMIFVGPPGSAKSMVAKAAGNCGGVPTIQLDLGAAKGSLVGQSEQQLRTALKVITAVSNGGGNTVGKSLWIATCNSIKDLPPELRRRFTLGTFFFDLPTAAERAVIWKIWLAKYRMEAPEVKASEARGQRSGMPSDAGWTGAEIRQCCEIAWRLDVPLAEASQFIVPVSKSASEQLERLRTFATGRLLSASKPGVYAGPEEEGSRESGVGRLGIGGRGNGKRKIAVED